MEKDILIRDVETKNIMTKSSLPVGGYSVNPYVGCTHGCKYCYASFMKRFTGHHRFWKDFWTCERSVWPGMVRKSKSPRWFQTGDPGLYSEMLSSPCYPVWWNLSQGRSKLFSGIGKPGSTDVPKIRLSFCRQQTALWPRRARPSCNRGLFLSWRSTGIGKYRAAQKMIE